MSSVLDDDDDDNKNNNDNDDDDTNQFKKEISLSWRRPRSLLFISSQ
jgi:hypothetical protein